MCGRFTITLDASDFENELRLQELPLDWRPRYNIAPSQDIPVVTDAEERVVTYMRWGLIPSWAKDERMGNRMINARAETVAAKPAFRAAFVQRRCLILADGFYEWKRFPEKKVPSQPYYFYVKGHKPFAFAGLWEVWKPPAGEEIRSCTIITCAANGVVDPIHERMPVILTGENCWKWLKPQRAPALAGLLKPYPEDGLDLHPVSRLVNSPEADTPDVIRPLAG